MPMYYVTNPRPGPSATYQHSAFTTQQSKLETLTSNPEKHKFLMAVDLNVNRHIDK